MSTLNPSALKANEEILRELRARTAEVEHRVDYWLMGVAGAAIAFAIQQTNTLALSNSMFLVGVAVIAWGWAFFAGYRRQSLLAESIMANYDSIHFFCFGKNDEAVAEFQKSQDIKKKVNDWGKLQFPALMIGALFYIAWHVIQMYYRAAK